jgi:glycosyltransferase involved in cell wall biosynthesis
LDEFLIKRFDAKTYYIGQMVNRDVFYPSQGRHNEKETSPFRILVVGPFEADFKNITVALRGIVLAKKRLKVPVKLIRASQFPFSDKEQAIIKPDAYHFRVPYYEMGEIYRGADLFISMSKEEEGFGLPALEAMACGVPTILSSISSYTNFDETRNHSLFVKTSDPESLADAIVEIFNNRTLKEKLIHQGLIVAGKFTKENVLNRLNSSFESILYRDKLE